MKHKIKNLPHLSLISAVFWTLPFLKPGNELYNHVQQLLENVSDQNRECIDKLPDDVIDCITLESGHMLNFPWNQLTAG